METGPWFIISSERLEERKIEPDTLGLHSQHAKHCAMAAFLLVCDNALNEQESMVSSRYEQFLKQISTIYHVLYPIKRDLTLNDALHSKTGHWKTVHTRIRLC